MRLIPRELIHTQSGVDSCGKLDMIHAIRDIRDICAKWFDIDMIRRNVIMHTMHKYYD